MVVAAKVGAKPVLQAGEHPPRNGQALWSLGLGDRGRSRCSSSASGSSFLVVAPGRGHRDRPRAPGRRRAFAEGIGGSRAARIGVILGVVGIALCVVACIAWILILVLDADFSDRLRPRQPVRADGPEHDRR